MTAGVGSAEPRGFVAPEMETLALELRPDGVAVLTIDRPHRANSQTTTMFSAGFDLAEIWQLTGLVGSGRAAEIALTGRLVLADEAERIGLVNRVVPAESLFDEAFALAASISANSQGGVRLSERALQRNQEIASYAAALELENRGQALLTRTADMPEALAAPRERRAPDFTGR